MADIKVRIEVNPNQETEFLGSIQNQVGTSGSTNNLSNVSVKTDSLAVFQNIPNRQNAISGINGLSLGQDLVFDENGYLDNQDLQGAVIEDEQNPDEFVWGVVPESGEYHVKLTFINAQNLKDIIVKGDDVVGQFPTQAIVDGQTTIYSDDSNWAINLQTESNTHTIEFTHWNRTGYNACLTLIAVMLRYFEVDKYNGLKSVESLSQSTGQPKEIFYGVVPSSGSLEIIDVNGEIREMVESGVMPNSNVNIDLFVNGNQVQQHISEDSSYESNNKLFNVSLTNNLQDWNNIKYAGLGIQLNKMTLYEILQQIFKATLNIDDIDFMLGNQMYYGTSNTRGTVKDYLQLIEIPNPFLEESTLNDAITKICTIAQLTVIKDNDGIIQFLSARPKMVSDETILCIPSKMQDSQPTKDLILKNKYINANVETFNVSVDTNKNTSVVSFVHQGEDDFNPKDWSYDVPATIDINTATQNYIVARVGAGYSEGSFKFQINKSLDGSKSYIPLVNALKNTRSITINIDSVPKMYEDNEYISITSNYILYSYEGQDSSTLSILNADINEIADEYSTYYQTQVPFTYAKSENYGNIGGSISANYTITQSVSATATKKDESYITLTLDGDVVTCTYKLLTRKTEIGARRDATNLLLYRNIKEYYATKINTDILGTKITFNFNSNNETQASTNNYTYNLTTNELMQDKATYRNQNLSNLIEQNIIKDYSNGIATIDMSIKCLDVYDINNKLVYEFSKGDILNIGDIVRIDKDNDGNSLYKYSNNKDIYFEVTGRTFRKSGVPLIDLELRETKPLFNSISFAEDDWSLIETISKTGTAELYYNIGDEKTITLTTGEQVTLQILDFNRDVADNGNVVGMTLGAKNLLNTKYPMNTTDTNGGGWQTSAMRTSTMQTIYNQLPSDLRTRVKQVKKQTYNGTSGIVETYDYVWLLSQIELSGSLLGTYEGEGMQYRYWQEHNTDNDRRKLTTSGAESAYWLRSPYTGDNFEFKIVSGSGQVSQFLNAEASWANGGVAFCLCV